MTSQKTLSTKVAIVGAGPVGLLLSKLLTSYHVPHFLIDRRIGKRHHPQAHYLNIRSMEIIKAHVPRVFRQILAQSPPSVTWRDFTYCHSVTGTEYARIDQLAKHLQSTEKLSPTFIMHLPQHMFEDILVEEVQRSMLEANTKSVSIDFPHSSPPYQFRQGMDANLVRIQSSGCLLQLSNNSEISQLRCEYLIAADGANSRIRQAVGLQLEGPAAIQSLINVHFVAPGLHRHLVSSCSKNTPPMRRPSMLYFVFHNHSIAVLVAHNIQQDEYVCQIPYFPPFQDPAVMSLLLFIIITLMSHSCYLFC
jgi:2-polyprenyl-6-methoxyphenol hydroxylase-like FAD-dependent oxidoreductase